VFVPFRIMFGEEFREIPIVQVSIDDSLSPEKNWALGSAIAGLRYVLVVDRIDGMADVVGSDRRE
jgi:aromatic ring-opening dioxygenase catalytic subunit (LigB family)